MDAAELADHQADVVHYGWHPIRGPPGLSPMDAPQPVENPVAFQQVGV